MKVLLIPLIIACALTACKQDPPLKQEAMMIQSPIVGNDRDTHGCIGSAGYTWSALKNKCIRVFEDGMRLNPIQPQGSAVISAFIVMEAGKNEVELFLPDQKTPTLLKSTTADTWGDGTYTFKKGTSSVLEKNNQAVYKSE